MSETPDLLSAKGIVKRFPGLVALDQVDFSLQSGRIDALMGENGAGKSTLIKVLTGALEAEEGEIWLDGRRIRPSTPVDAVRLGISTVYQELNLAPNLSVAENIALGREPKGPFGIRWNEVHRRAEQALARVGVSVDTHRPVGSCSTAVQQLVAIARALDVDARVLILDEPTSSLDRHEVEQLFGVVRRLKEQGLGILFVTHFLEQVYEISDRITVLRNGKKVAEAATAEMSRMALVGAMTGRDAAELERKVEGRRSKVEEGRAPILTARGLGRSRSVEGVDLSVRPGEAVGFAGLLGSGRTETVRLLYGIDRADKGVLSLARHGYGVRQAIRAGLGLCPEDRKAQGILPQLSVSDNILIALQAKRGWFRRITRKQRRQVVQALIEQLRIATPDADKPVDQLSGGNQQKVLLARWLAAEPKLLLLDEPTRGIDVGAKFEIMSEMERLRLEGMAFVFVSSEIPEIVRACTPVLVFRDRKMVAAVAGKEIGEDRLMRTMAEGGA